MKRRQHTPEFKFKVVKEAFKERHSIQELARRFEVHPVQISTWKKEFDQRAKGLFHRSNARKSEDQKQKQLDQCYQIIGQQKIEIEFFKKNL